LKKEIFGYVSGGYDKINSAFEKKLRSIGVTIILNTQVKQIFNDNLNNLIVETNTTDKYLFNKMISTLPSDISIQVAPSLSKELRYARRNLLQQTKV